MKFIILLLMIVLTAGCDLQPQQKVAKKPNLVVFAIDRTGSYNFVNQAKNIAAELVTRAAKAGDLWFFRYIDDASYTSKACIFTLHLPSAEGISQNPFDTDAKEKARRIKSAVGKLQQKAVSKLRSLNPTPAPYTDIYGAVAIAGEIFSNYKNYHKFIILATDLKDNLNLKGEVSLQGVTVVILMFEADKEPDITQKRLNMWQKYFAEKGAEKVVVTTPSEPLSLIEEVLR